MEYTILIVCIAAALIGMQQYVKRALQGRMRETADMIGDPYEANNTNSTTFTSLNSTTITNSTLVPIPGLQSQYGQPVTGYETVINQTVNTTRIQNEKITP